MGALFVLQFCYFQFFMSFDVIAACMHIIKANLTNGIFINIINGAPKTHGQFIKTGNDLLR